MSTKPKVIDAAPPLPPTSVDYDALQKAIVAGKSAEDVLTIATTGQAVSPKPQTKTTTTPDASGDSEQTSK